MFLAMLGSVFLADALATTTRGAIEMFLGFYFITACIVTAIHNHK